MNDLGMELHRVQASRRIRDRGYRAGFGGCEQHETFGQFFHLVAVAHPDLLTSTKTREQGIGNQDVQHRVTVLTALARTHAAPEQMRHQLLPVANAEDSGSERENTRIYGRAGGFVDAGWSSGDDEALAAFEFGSGCIGGLNLGVNSQFANTARNQVTILATGVKHRDLGAWCVFQICAGLGFTARAWQSVARSSSWLYRATP